MWLSALQTTLTLFAAALVAFALFWDRPGRRGRPALRCRKCWFDLTGAKDVTHASRESPITCPECGREHRSLRSMTRTRRRKRWMVAAAMVVAFGFVASGWARMKQIGWPGLVPTPILIASMPLLSAEPGSLPAYQSGSGTPVRQRGWQERLEQQIDTRLYEADQTTWLDHWLFVRMAQRESDATLTDRTCRRGKIYGYVFNAWKRQGRLSTDEHEWAESVLYFEVNNDDFALSGLPLYFRPRMRRLLTGEILRVQLCDKMYRLAEDHEKKDGYLYVFPEGRKSWEWWDGAADSNDPHLNNAAYFTNPPMDTRRIHGRVFAGDRAADVWWPVAQIDQKLSLRLLRPVKATSSGSSARPQPAHDIVQSIEGFSIIEDPKPFVQWIEAYARVDLDWNEKMGVVGPPTGLRLGMDKNALHKSSANVLLSDPPPEFTFGGIASLVLHLKQPEPLSGFGRDRVLVKSEGAWWALRDELDSEKRRVFEHNFTGPRFLPRDGDVGRVPGMVPDPSSIESASIVITFGTDVLGEDGYRPLADTEAQRFLAATVTLPITGRDLMRLKAYVGSLQPSQPQKDPG